MNPPQCKQGGFSMKTGGYFVKFLINVALSVIFSLLDQSPVFKS